MKHFKKSTLRIAGMPIFLRLQTKEIALKENKKISSDSAKRCPPEAVFSLTEKALPCFVNFYVNQVDGGLHFLEGGSSMAP